MYIGLNDLDLHSGHRVWRSPEPVQLIYFKWHTVTTAFCDGYLLTYLYPSLPVEHRPSTTPCHRTLFWSALAIPSSWSLIVSALLQCLASNSCEAGLSLPLRDPSQGLACGAGCWLPEGGFDPASLPLQYLLRHWFLSRSLPQIFISDLLLPLDFGWLVRLGKLLQRHLVWMTNVDTLRMWIV